ncbi:origin recognition complex subunit 5 [Sitodiplosis mosellana]|uniref:origin recognition complex subunit 5 n=1 Tax=Sitodiplosis mosellana TaxID=263140 RepID=UPI002444A697|nr:origin recognition complex subunit 5 [Sitodiplosis mosellana]
MEQILEEFPGRESYLKELFQLYGHQSHSFPSSVFISGASGTGKTATLLRFLDHMDIVYAYIDCIECYTSKMYFEAIVNSLSGHKLSPNNNFENYANCDSAEDFVDTLNGIDSNKSYVVVLKNFDRLHDIEANILPIMMRLNQFVPTINISCILIGSQTLLNYVGKQGLVPTITIQCDQYGKTDLLKILMKQINHLRRSMAEIINEGDSDEELRTKRLVILSELDERFFIGYFNIFLDTFFAICRNAKELVYLSNANFPIYCKPVIDGDTQENELRKLWEHMKLPFKMAMNSIYCRVEQKNTINSTKDLDHNGVVMSSTKAEVQKLELPHYTKFLLIAAYLASHNDAKIDKRLFVKHHGKQKKRMQNVRSNAVVSEKFSTQIGPKSFNIDRLLAIFYAINDTKVSLTSDLLVQISNLVRLKYLTFVSGENNIVDGSARLQCNVTLNFISMVGKHVGFNVRQYLCDFM